MVHPTSGTILEFVPHITEILPEGTAPRLDLVVPVLNEELRIGATIAAIHEATAGAPFGLELIVVDNGCVDTTTEIVDPDRWAIPIKLVSCRTRGKGAAVRAGIRHSTAPFVGYCDADLSTPPSAIRSGVDLLSAGWEVVIGSRRCAGASYVVPQTTLRRLGSFAFRTMASDVCGSISDTQCGFKLFRSDVAKMLFEPATLDGFAFDVEILARARRASSRMIELPIQWSDQDHSSFRPVADGLRSFQELRHLQRAFRRPMVSVGEP
jgi:dolichyl-phosphate beta-glucosyltransferase